MDDFGSPRAAPPRPPPSTKPAGGQSGLSPELAASLETMARLRIDEGTVTAMLDRIVALACGSIAEVDDASISLVRGNRLETTSARSEEVRDVDRSQYRTGGGPCVCAIREGVRYNVVFSDEAHRWPEFVAGARAVGLHSAVSTPMVSGDRVMGAVNLYSHRPQRFGDHDVAAARVFADHAAVVLANAVSYADAEATGKQLETALEASRIIGRAQGVIMARENCSSDAAFDILRRASQRSNRKLREVAADITAPLDGVPART